MLKEVASRATPGPWRQFNNGTSYTEDATGRQYALMVAPADNRPGHIAVELTKEDATFIAAFDPTTCLELLEEVERLTALIDTPHTDDFLRAVPLEAAHQIKRWSVHHDQGKTPWDWFWLIGYLAQKAASAALTGDTEKARHHTISTAAVLLNWFRRLHGEETTFQPGVDLASHPDAAALEGQL